MEGEGGAYSESRVLHAITPYRSAIERDHAKQRTQWQTLRWRVACLPLSSLLATYFLPINCLGRCRLYCRRTLLPQSRNVGTKTNHIKVTERPLPPCLQHPFVLHNSHIADQADRLGCLRLLAAFFYGHCGRHPDVSARWRKRVRVSGVGRCADSPRLSFSPGRSTMPRAHLDVCCNKKTKRVHPSTSSPHFRQRLRSLTSLSLCRLLRGSRLRWVLCYLAKMDGSIISTRRVNAIGSGAT